MPGEVSQVKPPAEPIVQGVTHCRRCSRRLIRWFVLPLCDPCLDWEIVALKAAGKQNTSWMDHAW